MKDKDDKEMAKKLTDKEFLRTNDFQDAVVKMVQTLKDNKNLVIGALVVGVLLIVLIPSLKWMRLQKVSAFNQDLYKAEKSLKKESLYQEILKKHADLPAHQIVRLQLVNTYLDHGKKDDAFKEIQAGLKQTEPDVFTTLLVLKNVNLLKQDKKYADAASFLKSHQNKVLKSFVKRSELMQADLLFLSGKKDDAKKIYKNLSLISNAPGAQDKNQDPSVASKAKDKLLLIDLGIL